MATSTSKRYLSRAEVATMFEVSPNTISRWVKTGKLPFSKTLGGRHRYLRDEIERLLEETNHSSTQRQN